MTDSMHSPRRVFFYASALMPIFAPLICAGVQFPSICADLYAEVVGKDCVTAVVVPSTFNSQSALDTPSPAMICAVMRTEVTFATTGNVGKSTTSAKYSVPGVASCTPAATVAVSTIVKKIGILLPMGLSEIAQCQGSCQ